MVLKSNVIAVFGGGAESGKRALGNRSIIADPRDKKVLKYINDEVKHREWFRPIAPSILREEVINWFEYDINSPYMSFVVKFKKSVRDKAKAVVHFDGSGRLQTVNKELNSKYYSLIKEFNKITDVPVILNTSFNENEPIVCKPEEALDCFLRTKMDVLVLENILIKRI